MRDQMKTALGPEEVDHLRNQFEPFVVRQLIHPIESRFETDSAIARLQDQAIIVARFDARVRAQREGKVDGHGAGMEQVEGPDVDGAAGKIGAGRSRRFNDHFDYSKLIDSGLSELFELANFKFEI